MCLLVGYYVSQQKPILFQPNKYFRSVALRNTVNGNYATIDIIDNGHVKILTAHNKLHTEEND